MDRNSIIGLAAIFLILIGYSLWMSPSQKELEQRKLKMDSIAMVEKRQAAEDSMAAVQAKLKNDTAQPQQNQHEISVAKEKANRDTYGTFSNSASGKESFVVLESDLLKIKLSNKGGGIRSVELKTYKDFNGKPLMLVQSDTSITGFTFFANNRSLNTTGLFFQPYFSDTRFQGKDSVKVTGKDSVSFSFRLYPDAGDSAFNLQKYIEYRYVIKGNDYMTGYYVRFVGMNDILAPNVTYINLDFNLNLRQQEKSHDNEKNVSSVYYKYFQDDVDYLSESKNDQKTLKTRVKWISFKQQFFATTLIAKESFSSAEIKTQIGKPVDRYLKTMNASITIPLNLAKQSFETPMNFYFGPNKYKLYRSYGLDQERQIPLGWSFFLLAWINKYAVIPIFDFLSNFGWNYGIIILILTLLLKLVLFPIAYKTYLSSAKMRVLKPEIDEIGKSFPKKEDAMKKQQATMALYKRAGINPLSGCIPLLLQMPILIAMFRFFPASIELRQQAFLWASDLSSYDSIANLPFTIPFYGNHVSLFTLLMTISTIIYTKLNNDMMAGSTQQMPGMKTMMYLMPIMFLGFFNSYSSGLSYYYLLANLITFAQMWGFRNFINEEKIHLQIQENKKKPVKKSGFQKRLEEMAKKQGYPVKK